MSHTIELRKVSKYYSDEDSVSMGFSRVDLDLPWRIIKEGSFMMVIGIYFLNMGIWEFQTLFLFMCLCFNLSSRSQKDNHLQ